MPYDLSDIPKWIKEAQSKLSDPHTYVASKIFEVSESDVTKDMRQQAKNINYVFLYSTKGIEDYAL